jgi:hypothetical protein
MFIIILLSTTLSLPYRFSNQNFVCISLIIRMLCLSNRLTCLHFITVIVLGEGNKLQSFLLRCFLRPLFLSVSHL